MERLVMGNYHARCGLGENPDSLKLQRITYQYRIIVVPPLKDQSENPFKGGKIEGFDYIILVDNAHLDRNYGTTQSLTEIMGNVTIMGDLRFKQRVNLINLHIYGKLDVNIGNGDVKVSKASMLKLFFAN